MDRLAPGLFRVVVASGPAARTAYLIATTTSQLAFTDAWAEAQLRRIQPTRRYLTLLSWAFNRKLTAQGHDTLLSNHGTKHWDLEAFIRNSLDLSPERFKAQLLACLKKRNFYSADEEERQRIEALQGELRVAAGKKAALLASADAGVCGESAPMEGEVVRGNPLLNMRAAVIDQALAGILRDLPNSEYFQLSGDQLLLDYWHYLTDKRPAQKLASG
jgi:hypothetical protein